MPPFLISYHWIFNKHDLVNPLVKQQRTLDQLNVKNSPVRQYSENLLATNTQNRTITAPPTETAVQFGSQQRIDTRNNT